jgi:hypothetical protein
MQDVSRDISGVSPHIYTVRIGAQYEGEQEPKVFIVPTCDTKAAVAQASEGGP